ncbi:MAG: tRNA (N6-isopentenyl adenosine(37)-C2)-methylthiotransferase MiaB [Candidatus Niyogibacteria bacterium]|nr:tRNA (N6-isopentenyl adenosine(37)-C2)-methylthiotransferase MiaB [Candidatus Niyogibacteria bacterium]
MSRHQTYYLKTFGCQSNLADSNRIRWILESCGYQNAAKEDGADLIIYNTCSVRESAENRVFGRNKILKKIKEKNPRLKTILTGCMTHYRKDILKKRLPYIDYFLPIKDIASLPEKIGSPLKITAEEYLSIPPKTDSSFRALIPVSYGCNNFCAYCVVPFARGREYSRPAKEILAEAKKSVKNGAKEIWLLGQNVNSYGLTEKTAWEGKTKSGEKPKIKKGCMTFANLLRAVNKIPGNFWIRFTSAHPKDFSDDLIKAMAKCEKFPKYLNLPVQSGDDEVLKRMNRQYTRKHFIKLVKKIRRRVPEIAISTDTIVGFCGETEKEFSNTLKLYRELKFDMAFIAEYSPRPNTASALAFKDNITHQAKERRRKKLNEILKKTAAKNSKKLLGKILPVLIDEKKNGRFFGKSPQNKTVEIVNSRKQKIGDFSKVKIIKIGPWMLEGKLI